MRPDLSAWVAAVVLHDGVLAGVFEQPSRRCADRTEAMRHVGTPILHIPGPQRKCLLISLRRYVWSRRGPPKSAPWTVEQEAVSESPFDLDDRFPALSTGDPSPDVVLIGSFIVQ